MYVYKAAIGKQFDYLFPHTSSSCLARAGMMPAWRQCSINLTATYSCIWLDRTVLLWDYSSYVTMLPKEIAVLFPFYDRDNQQYNIHVISEYWNFLSLQNNWAIVTVLSTVDMNQSPKPNFDINAIQTLKSPSLYLHFSQDCENLHR